jgi:hypothetical protein
LKPWAVQAKPFRAPHHAPLARSAFSTLGCGFARHPYSPLKLHLDRLENDGGNKSLEKPPEHRRVNPDEDVLSKYFGESKGLKIEKPEIAFRLFVARDGMVWIASRFF